MILKTGWISNAGIRNSFGFIDIGIITIMTAYNVFQIIYFLILDLNFLRKHIFSKLKKIKIFNIFLKYFEKLKKKPNNFKKEKD